MPYDTLPPKETLAKTIEALKANNINVHLVDTKEQALDMIKTLVPTGAELMTGGSTTLEQIGFIDLLKTGLHPWKSFKDKIFAEKDQAKQMELRKQSVLADYFLASVHGITEAGETVTASFSGSQIPSFVFTSPHVIWVAGAQKIVPTLEDALKRVREYCLPREDQRMKSLGTAGSSISMMLIYNRQPLPSRTIDLILVNEVVGV